MQRQPHCLSHFYVSVFCTHEIVSREIPHVGCGGSGGAIWMYFLLLSVGSCFMESQMMETGTRRCKCISCFLATHSGTVHFLHSPVPSLVASCHHQLQNEMKNWSKLLHGLQHVMQIIKTISISVPANDHMWTLIVHHVGVIVNERVKRGSVKLRWLVKAAMFT